MTSRKTFGAKGPSGASCSWGFSFRLQEDRAFFLPRDRSGHGSFSNWELFRGRRQEKASMAIKPLGRSHLAYYRPTNGGPSTNSYLQRPRGLCMPGCWACLCIHVNWRLSFCLPLVCSWSRGSFGTVESGLLLGRCCCSLRCSWYGWFRDSKMSCEFFTAHCGCLCGVWCVRESNEWTCASKPRIDCRKFVIFACIFGYLCF